MYKNFWSDPIALLPVDTALLKTNLVGIVKIGFRQFLKLLTSDGRGQVLSFIEFLYKEKGGQRIFKKFY